jgi:hypothetical protein
VDLDADWEAYAGREQLIAEVRDAQLARRIFYGLGERALSWLDESVPALGGTSPRQCLKTREGRRLLSALTSRFPL